MQRELPDRGRGGREESETAARYAMRPQQGSNGAVVGAAATLPAHARRQLGSTRRRHTAASGGGRGDQREVLQVEGRGSKGGAGISGNAVANLRHRPVGSRGGGSPRRHPEWCWSYGLAAVSSAKMVGFCVTLP